MKIKTSTEDYVNLPETGKEQISTRQLFQESSDEVSHDNRKETKKPLLQIYIEELLAWQPSNNLFKTMLKKIKVGGRLVPKEVMRIKKAHDYLKRTNHLESKSSRGKTKFSGGNMAKTDSPCGEK